jgi:hypothetical protein
MIFNIEYIGDYYFIINGNTNKVHLNDIDINNIEQGIKNDLLLFIRKLKLYHLLNKSDKDLIGFKLYCKFTPNYDFSSLYPNIMKSYNIIGSNYHPVIK